ncbi:reverse transcriptase domain-containing protein [Tanacetum coccineum]|uniref:Reverse transcriptase domain-containing protein n=1 Tax=Tanacetum coccineum TaxID=301880 RepID=A0ABQ5HLS4_9ASTR
MKMISSQPWTLRGKENPFTKTSDARLYPPRTRSPVLSKHPMEVEIREDHLSYSIGRINRVGQWPHGSTLKTIFSKQSTKSWIRVEIPSHQAKRREKIYGDFHGKNNKGRRERVTKPGLLKKLLSETAMSLSTSEGEKTGTRHGNATKEAKEKRTDTGKNNGNPRRGGKNSGNSGINGKRSIINSRLSNPIVIPLPEIDWKVESSVGILQMASWNAYKGYHQLNAKEDEEKTAFITSQGIFCYSKMPFGLKNVGSTYQRLVDKAFQRQIGHKHEIAPKEVHFSEAGRTFLGYKVNTNGLRACPDKADAVLSLPSPRCIKDVQKLNGKLASLNRFLQISARKKSLPFFKTLKKCTKKSDFQWTPEAEEAFKQMKKLIAELPTLTAPREHEELIIYLAAAKEAISAVLMTDREGRQIPVYFVSRTLRGPEVNYTPMEKLVLALLSANQRLKDTPSPHVRCNNESTYKAIVVKSSEIPARMGWKVEGVENLGGGGYDI